MSNFDLPDDITYWPIDDVDDNNKITWTAGIKVKARWVRKDGIVIDDQGKNQKSSYVIYSETLIPKRSQVFLGNAEGEAEPRDDSREVIDNVENPSSIDLFKMVL